MSRDRQGGFFRAIDLSFVLGAAGTGAFYWAINQPPLTESIIHRYASEHAVEYVIVALFIWGVMDAILKALALPREILALRQDWLPARQGREPLEAAATLLEGLRSRAGWLQRSKVGRRLIRALEDVEGVGTSQEYRERLQHLAEQDEDTLHTDYMLIRFVAGVTPVLGFLGTVVHFGTALSGISFQTLAAKMTDVVAEMGSAFNTTTVALSAAMTMLFALFICDRIERAILRAIDRMVGRDLVDRFDAKDPSILPFLSAVETANEEALRSIAANLHRQTEVWTQSLGALFQRFDQRQQQENSGWREALDVLRERHEAYDKAREERLKQTLAMVDSRQDAHLTKIQGMLERAIGVRDDLSGLMKNLEAIARGEGKLRELQGALSDNLRVIRDTQQLDEALHGLTAAIHLITARSRTSSHHDSAAA